MRSRAVVVLVALLFLATLCHAVTICDPDMSRWELLWYQGRNSAFELRWWHGIGWAVLLFGLPAVLLGGLATFGLSRGLRRLLGQGRHDPRNSSEGSLRVMSYQKLDLRPRNLRERWFQYVVNYARHGWMIVLCAVVALGFFIWAARSDELILLYMGIIWAAIALVWFERNIAYHVCKRLQESDSSSRHHERCTGGAGEATPAEDECLPGSEDG